MHDPRRPRRWQRPLAIALIAALLLGVGWWYTLDPAEGPLPEPRLLLPVQRDGLWGLIDADGAWVLPPEYTSLRLYGKADVTDAGWITHAPIIWQDGTWWSRLSQNVSTGDDAKTYLIDAIRPANGRTRYQPKWPFILRNQASVPTQYIMDSSASIRLIVSDVYDSRDAEGYMIGAEIPIDRDVFRLTERSQVAAGSPIMFANQKSYIVRNHRISRIELPIPAYTYIHFAIHESGTIIRDTTEPTLDVTSPTPDQTSDAPRYSRLSPDGATDITDVMLFDPTNRFLLIQTGDGEEAIAGPDGQALIAARRIQALRHDVAVAETDDGTSVLLVAGVDTRLALPGIVERLTGQVGHPREARLSNAAGNETCMVAVSDLHIAVRIGEETTIYDNTLTAITRIATPAHCRIRFAPHRELLMVRDAHLPLTTVYTMDGTEFASGDIDVHAESGTLYERRSDGLAIVTSTGTRIDLPGATHLTAPAWTPRDNFAVVSFDVLTATRTGLIDREGQWIVPPRDGRIKEIVDAARTVGDPSIIVTSQQLDGGTARWVVDSIHTTTTPNFLTSCYANSAWIVLISVLDDDIRPTIFSITQSKWLTEAYKNVIPFSDDLLRVETDDEKVGYLRADGTWLYEPTK